MITRLCTLLFALTLAPALQASLSVVASTADFASIAQEIGGKHIQLTTLAKPTEDPHAVDPKPSLVVKLRNADVLIEGGAELEIGWLPPLLERARNPKLAPGKPGRVLANRHVEMLEVPTQLDRSKGDVHAAGNPHFLSDPQNAILLAKHLAEVFSSLDSSSAAGYDANLKSFLSRIESKMETWKTELAPYKGQTIAGYHNSWPYFARRFGLEIHTFLEPNPGMPPTATHLAEVVSQMKKENTKLIIVDSYLDRRTADSVAGRTGAKVAVVSLFPGAIKGTDTYIELMDYLVHTVAAGLR